MSTSTRHVDDAAESSVAGDSQVDDTDAESESDDAHTAREDDDSAEEGEDDPDHEYRKSIVKDEHEVQDDIDQEISATTSAMEAEVLKLLGPPTDSGVGSEMAV
jgi:hypothetical protein